MSGGSLEVFVLDNAGRLDDAAVFRARGDSHEVVVLDTLVAVVEPGALEVRLRPAVAAAALRTPDVSASRRGPGWVRFEPVALDDSARDRALAWLESSIRLAAEGGRPN